MTDAARFYDLVRWFRSIGVCFLCGMDGAIAMVEREAGREWKPADTRACEERDRSGRTCRDLAELCWKERPARPLPEKPKRATKG